MLAPINRDALPLAPPAVVDNYRGGFIGLLRPELYERLLAALPPGTLQVNKNVTSFKQDETEVIRSRARSSSQMETPASESCARRSVMVSPGRSGLIVRTRRWRWARRCRRAVRRAAC
jgi:hypothetical protein